jgi:glycosyltransferase involved in cell wall biosynthesis
MSKNISIIISAFNEAPYIQETINSLNRFDDVTILDNNSSDDTVKIIERAQKYQSIKLYKNNIQKKPLQNMCFLINKSAYECIYFLGADDYLHVIEDVIIELPVKSYKIPYINYFDDGSRDVYCVYPEENWLSELLNAKDAASIVKAQLNYAGHDVHVLGLHSKINLIEACKNLKFNCVEGISFWLVLCSLLSAHMHGSPPIEIERRFSVFKRNNNLHATGTHSEKSTHNVQPKNII